MGAAGSPFTPVVGSSMNQARGVLQLSRTQSELARRFPCTWAQEALIAWVEGAPLWAGGSGAPQSVGSCGPWLFWEAGAQLSTQFGACCLPGSRAESPAPRCLQGRVWDTGWPPSSLPTPGGAATLQSSLPQWGPLAMRLPPALSSGPEEAAQHPWGAHAARVSSWPPTESPGMLGAEM